MSANPNIAAFRIPEPTQIEIVPLRSGLFTYAEAGEVLRVSVRTIKRLIAAKKLSTIPVLGSRRILHSEIIRFLQQGGSE